MSRKTAKYFLGAVGVVAALVAAEVVTLVTRVGGAVPAPSAVIPRGLVTVTSGDFLSALGSTMLSVFIGISLVLLVGTPLGLLLGRSSFWADSTWYVAEFLKPIPAIAILPLVLLIMGPTLEMKSFLVFYGAVWPLLVQVSYGSKNIETNLIDLIKSYHVPLKVHVRRVLIPAVLPYLLTGLRISATIALVVSVVVEMIAGMPGLGRNLMLAQSNADFEGMYVYVAFAGLTGLAINGFFVLINKPLLFWHPSVRNVNA